MTMTKHTPRAPVISSAATPERIFDAQRETALLWRHAPSSVRFNRLKTLKQAILAHREDIIAAGAADFNKPAAEVELTEILPVIAEINSILRQLRRWLRPKRVWPTRLMVGTQGYVQYEPRGRVLIISPWNYPINLSFGPLAYAIAAGNTVILKPSEMAPRSSAIMRKIIRGVFSEDEVAVIEGDAQTAEALLALPFDHIFFTGSPAIGKVVMAAAAKNLTSVTLELGGKSPVIVDETADLAEAARTILWAKLTNNGQTCIAPDHVYVHDSVKQAFIDACIAALNQAYGPAAERMRNPDLARIVNHKHTQRLAHLLQDAIDKGAQVMAGGEVVADERYIAPTLLANVPEDATIMQEEIFGPILPLMSYTSLDAVIAKINAAPKPLALYIWSKDQQHIDQIMQQTSSGGACINHCVVQFMHGNLPFGGVNNSGIGNTHGKYGFIAFSHERAVVRGRLMTIKMLFPPYTKKIRQIARLMTWIS